MSEEPKKISFGFSKVNKKSNLILIKKEKEIKNDIQFIECLEEKSIKVLGGEEKEKEAPIIPMRNGNFLKENIREVVKLRAQKRSEQDGQHNVTSKEDGDVALESVTLDELAAREILEDLKQSNDNKKEECYPTLPLTTKVTIQDRESSLEDYENMPIADFGLAMLRGMGWNPKKGIGLNEKIVTPLAPTLRPKGMGLGADKVPNSKNVASNGEVLIMKKGASVKIVSGPHNNLYGKIEGFDELPGRLMVRIAESSVIVSLNEIMVQLVSTYEYNKNVEIESVQTLRTEKLNRPDYSHEKSSVIKKTTSKSHSLNDKESSAMNSSNYNRNSREQENLINGVNGKEQLETKKLRKDVCSKSSDFDDMEDTKFIKKRRKNAKRNSSSSSDSSSSYKQIRSQEQKKYFKSRRRDNYKESKFNKKSCGFTSSESSRRNRKSSRRDKYESSSSSDPKKKDYAKHISKRSKGKRSKSSDSSSSSDSYRKSHSKKYYKR